jgi:hypothetical protein
MVAMRVLPSASSWDDYRRRRRLFWIAFLGYLPVVASVGLFLKWLFGSEVPFLVLALTWMAFFFVAGIRMNTFPCPRCGKPFFQTLFYGNPLAKRCVRCGWPKWEPVPGFP